MNGNDSNDGTINHPVKSINQATTLANRRRFVGSSQCYIRLLSDYAIGNKGSGDNIVTD